MEYRFRRPIHPGISSILYIIGADFLRGGDLFQELIYKSTLYVLYFFLGVASTFKESVKKLFNCCKSRSAQVTLLSVRRTIDTKLINNISSIKR